MNLGILIDNRDLIIASMAAVSAFAGSLVVAWPYIMPDTLAIRMRKVANERERIRLRERARLGRDNKQTSLRSEPKKLFKAIVNGFNLAAQADDGKLIRMLQQAGYRGQAPLVTYIAVRVLAPVVMFCIATFYVFFVLKLEQLFVMKLGIVIAVALAGYYLPALYVKNRITKRQTAIRRAWPDALDLLLICVESGMGVESAFRKVAEEIGLQCAELGEELSLTTAELAYLEDRRTAYENLGDRTDLEGVRAVVTSLTQAEKHGTPLGQALRVIAQEVRDMRMSEAERKAAALPPKLTVPMILFFLPVLFAVILTPAIIQIVNL